jgi:hypothetical protein
MEAIPTLTASNPSHGPVADAKALRNLRVRNLGFAFAAIWFSLAYQLTYLGDLLLRELRHRVLLSKKTGNLDAAFRAGVLHVVHVVALEEMLRIKARRIVARMKREFGWSERADKPDVREPMNQVLALLNRDATVAMSVRRKIPNEAAVARMGRYCLPDVFGALKICHCGIF